MHDPLTLHSNWEETELQSLDLGDKRLNKRLKFILNAFASHPTASIAATFDSWHEIKASYRFFDNNKVSPAKILEPHQLATQSRYLPHNTILHVQDTTVIDFSHRSKKVENLGKLRMPFEQGYFMHTTLAFSDDSVCLGVVDNKTWVRTELMEPKLRIKSRPIENKESLRWIQSFQITQALAKQYPEKTFFNIADREADFYQLFSTYDPINSKNAHLLVRAKSDRIIKEEDGSTIKMWEKISKEEPLFQIEFQLDKEEECQRQTQTIQQTVKMCKVQLRTPEKVRRYKEDQVIELTGILCTQINTSGQEEPIEWLLLTTKCVQGVEEIRELIKYYVYRWQIELYFKILKSGCTIQKLQLESRERIEKCIAVYMITAWRLLMIMRLGRSLPEVSCEIVYSKQEWEVAYRMAKKKAAPKEAPTLNQMNKIVAGFGGFLNRKSDKDPGIKTMWIGLQRLRDFIFAYESLL